MPMDNADYGFRFGSIVCIRTVLCIAHKSTFWGTKQLEEPDWYTKGIYEVPSWLMVTERPRYLSYALHEILTYR